MPVPLSIGFSTIEEKLEPDGCIGFSFKVKELDEPGPIVFAFGTVEEKMEPNSDSVGSATIFFPVKLESGSISIGLVSIDRKLEPSFIGFSGVGSVGVTTLELDKFEPAGHFGFEIIKGNLESSLVEFAIGGEKLEPGLVATIGRKFESSLIGFA